MFRSPETRLLLLCAALFAAASAFALSSDKHQPMNIQADHGEFRNNTRTNAGTGTYTGHVLITQGSIRISADKAVVKTLNGALQDADITGSPATFQQQSDKGEMIHGRADRIHYHADTNQVDMTGHAHMQQGLRQMSADVIHYNTETEYMVATGGKDGERVHITVPPKQDSGQPAAGGPP
ncbi:MAG TPA: lipopolysaccharide transport periplasmic protein LptA [Gammaproteobacteria bacterium]|nr:lipopolysaccharide transport periplasmic protein LptA [Gammaproteobacteria bacterium]